MNNTDREIPEQSVDTLRNIGPKRKEAFNNSGIQTLRDLLFYFPYRHLDRSNMLSILKAYQYVIRGYDGEITIAAEAGKMKEFSTKRNRIVTAEFIDDTGKIECIWYKGGKYIKNKISEGKLYALSGKPIINKQRVLQIPHPDYDLIDENDSSSAVNTGKIIPLYSIPAEWKQHNISVYSLRTYIMELIDSYLDTIQETLPEEIVKKNELMPLKEAVRAMHFPESSEELEKAYKRFKYEELFFIQTMMAMRQLKLKDEIKGINFEIDREYVNAFVQSLPFKLTGAQLKAVRTISADMESSAPMNRLLQGDVGSGKTIVALTAMLTAARAGYQSALMAPTEVLAWQHRKTIEKLLAAFSGAGDITIAFISGGQNKKERKESLDKVVSGEANIVIGTHALFEDAVNYHKLGLAVIDEQHRFGVKQRSELISKGASPDVLIMSATPIPRTLTMTLYGDLDVSIINEMPAYRKPAKTHLRHDGELKKIYNGLVKKAEQGIRSYIIYPLVDESDKLELKAVEKYYNELNRTYFKNARTNMLHGKMNWKEKEEIMKAFAAGEFDILFSTTVIEVGIDVPEANIIIINDAHRFGLSQLHQLRGRVGRGSVQAHCLFVTKREIVKYAERLPSDISYLSSAQLDKYKAAVRLKTMAESTDGFRIAETDLKLRGPGDIFGVKQSGIPELKFADLKTDLPLLEKAREDAFALVKNDPSLSKPSGSKVQTTLKLFYKDSMVFYNIS